MKRNSTFPHSERPPPFPFLNHINPDHSLTWYFFIICFTFCCLHEGLPSDLFPEIFLPKFWGHFTAMCATCIILRALHCHVCHMYHFEGTSLPCVPHVSCVLSSSIRSPLQCMVKSMNSEIHPYTHSVITSSTSITFTVYGEEYEFRNSSLHSFSHYIINLDHLYSIWWRVWIQKFILTLIQSLHHQPRSPLQYMVKSMNSEIHPYTHSVITSSTSITFTVYGEGYGFRNSSLHSFNHYIINLDHLYSIWWRVWIHKFIITLAQSWHHKHHSVFSTRLSLPYPQHWFEPDSSQIHSRRAAPLPSATLFRVFVSLWLALLAWILVVSSCHCGSTAHTRLSGWTYRSLWTHLLPPLEWTSSLCGPASVQGAPVHPCTVTVTVLFILLVTNWGLCSSGMLC